MSMIHVIIISIHMVIIMEHWWWRVAIKCKHWMILLDFLNQPLIELCSRLWWHILVHVIRTSLNLLIWRHVEQMRHQTRWLVHLWWHIIGAGTSTIILMHLKQILITTIQDTFMFFLTYKVHWMIWWQRHQGPIHMLGWRTSLQVGWHCGETWWQSGRWLLNRIEQRMRRKRHLSVVVRLIRHWRWRLTQN